MIRMAAVDWHGMLRTLGDWLPYDFGSGRFRQDILRNDMPPTFRAVCRSIGMVTILAATTEEIAMMPDGAGGVKFASLDGRRSWKVGPRGDVVRIDILASGQPVRSEIFAALP